MIPSLLYPGRRIALEDRISFDLRDRLYHASGALVNAAVALNDFNTARNNDDHMSADEARTAFLARREVFERAVVEARGNGPKPQTSTDMHRERLAANQLLLRQLELEGRIPPAWKTRRPFQMATLFVLALDDLTKILRRASKDIPEAAPSMQLGLTAIENGLPHLRNLRDSIAHMDERLLGQEYGRPIPLPDNVLEVLNLEGRNLVSTSAKGNKSRVPISEESLVVARDATQAVIDSLPWLGPAESWPDALA